MQSAVTGDVPGATRTGTVLGESAPHGVENDRVLAHTEVVVGAPDIHLIRGVGRMSDSELASQAVDVVEVPVGSG